MATHSSALASKIPWTGEHGGLQSTGSQSWTQRSNFTFSFQWLGLGASTARGLGSIPGWGTKFLKPHGMAKKKKIDVIKIVF